MNPAYTWSKGRRGLMPQPAGQVKWKVMLMKTIEFGLMVGVCVMLVYSLAP